MRNMGDLILMKDINAARDIHMALSEALDPGSGIVEEFTEPVENESSVMYKASLNNISFVVTGWPRHMWCYVTKNDEKISNAVLCQGIDNDNLRIMQNMLDEIGSGKYDNKKTLSEKRLDVIRERGLTSYMNDTKWNELINDISRIDGLPIMYKTLFDESDPETYWTIKSDEYFYHTDKADIEWFKILCVIQKKRKNGRLLDPKTIELNIKDEIENILKEHSIGSEYDQEENAFTVYGYR